MGFGKTPRLRAILSGLSLGLSLCTLDCLAGTDRDPPPADISPKAQELWLLFFSSDPKYDGMGDLVENHLGYPSIKTALMDTFGPAHMEFLSHQAVVLRLREGFKVMMNTFFELEREYTEHFLPTHGYVPIHELASQMLSSLEALESAGGDLRKVPELIAEVRTKSSLGLDAVPGRGSDYRTLYQRTFNQQMEQNEYQEKAASKKRLNKRQFEAWKEYWDEELLMLLSNEVNHLLPELIRASEKPWLAEILEERGDWIEESHEELYGEGLQDFLKSVVRWRISSFSGKKELLAEFQHKTVVVRLKQLGMGPSRDLAIPVSWQRCTDHLIGPYFEKKSETTRRSLSLRSMHFQLLQTLYNDLDSNSDEPESLKKSFFSRDRETILATRLRLYLFDVYPTFARHIAEWYQQSLHEVEISNRGDWIFPKWFEVFSAWSPPRQAKESAYILLLLRGLQQSPDHWKERDGLAQFSMTHERIPRTGMDHPLLSRAAVSASNAKRSAESLLNTNLENLGQGPAITPTGYFSNVSNEAPAPALNTTKEAVSRGLTQEFFRLAWKTNKSPIDLLLTKKFPNEAWIPIDLNPGAVAKADVSVISSDFAMPDGRWISIPTPKDSQIVKFAAQDAHGPLDSREFQILKTNAKDGYLLQFLSVPRPIQFHAEFRFVAQPKKSHPALSAPTLRWDAHMHSIVARMEALGYASLSEGIRTTFSHQSTLSLKEFSDLISVATRYSYKPEIPAMDHSETMEGLTRFLVNGDFHAQCDGSASLLRAILNPYLKATAPSVTLQARSLFSQVTDSATAGDLHAENEVFIDAQSSGFLDATPSQFAPGESKASISDPTTPSLKAHSEKPSRTAADFAAMDEKFLTSLENTIHSIGLVTGFKQMVQGAGQSGANSKLPHKWVRDRFYEIKALLAGTKGAPSVSTLLRFEAIAVEARQLWKDHDAHVETVTKGRSKFRQYPALYSSPIHLATRAMYQRLSEMPGILQVSERLAALKDCTGIAEGQKLIHH